MGASPPPPPKKKWGKYFSANYHVKFWHFFRQNHVKFGNFVNFSYIFFGQNVLPPKVDWAPTHMLTRRHVPRPSCLLVNLTPATYSATPRSMMYHGFSSSYWVLTRLLEYEYASQLVLSPSLPWLAGYGPYGPVNVLLRYEGRLSATLTSNRPSTTHSDVSYNAASNRFEFWPV